MYFQVDQPAFALDDRRHYLRKNDSSVKRHKNFILDIALSLKPDLDKKETIESIERAFEVEKRLAQVSSLYIKSQILLLCHFSVEVK